MRNIHVPIAALLVLAIVYASFFTWLNTPVVQYSNSTHRCVRVLNVARGSNYSCANLPSKYTTEWVK